MAPDIPLTAPHAVISRWLDENHKAPVKGYAVSPPRSQGPLTVLEIRLLDDGLTDRLLAGSPVGESVRLGRHHFTVAATPHADVVQPWEDLRPTTHNRAWEVEFASPVTFRRGSRTSPLPAPESILTSLISRWRQLHPATAPVVERGFAQSLWVSDIEGRSHTLPLRDTIVSGFVGRVRYVSDGTPDQAQAVDALLRFASFAGIGSHTAFGLGTIAVRPTWQPGLAGTKSTSTDVDWSVPAIETKGSRNMTVSSIDADATWGRDG
jgi:CRISPR-associated endoribonuclease Cas6